MGGMGPHEGQASVYKWHWYDSVLGLLPWLILITAAVGVKANRNPRTLLLLGPLALVNLLYWSILFVISLRMGSPMTASSQTQFDLLFYPLAIGVTLLWLAAPVFERLPAAGRGLAAVVLMIALAALAVVSYGTASSDETTFSIALLGLLGAALALSPAAAARLCGHSYQPVAFMLWLAMWLIVGGVLAVLGILAVLVSVGAGPSVSELLRLVQQGVVVGAMIGLCLYVLYLPYMLLGFASPFFRARLQACLNLERPRDPAGV
jgi:hypothetical protein